MSRRLLKKTVCLLFCAALLLSLAPAVLAADIDNSLFCELSLRCEASGYPVKGLEFRLYRLAEVSGAGPDVTVLAPFSGYPISLDVHSQAEWNDLAETLKNYVAADHPAPSAIGTTGADGKLTLSGLATGLYLVLGSSVKEGTKEYIPSPFVVCLPGKDTGWTYTVESTPKLRVAEVAGARRPAPTRTVTSSETPPEPDIEEFDSLRILKAWVDGDAEDRPEAVTVKLYCDGTLYATAVLDEAASWRKVFDALPAGHDWSVVEEVPEGYTVQVTREGSSILLTNTKPVTEIEKVEFEVDESLAGNETRLPQLGLLWWPVPILAASALFCFLLSAILRRRSRL